MAAVVLILLALVGGSVATYFAMDAPRRRAEERLARLEADRADLEHDREAHLEQSRKLDLRSRQLAAAVASHEKREAEFASRDADFNRRVISYSELASENRVLRVELKNALAHAAYLEQIQHTHNSMSSAVARQRDQLGRDYFDEVVAAARKALTPTTYTTCKQRVRAAAERLRSAGFALAKSDEDKALGDLHSQFERAVRASVEREEQARLREQIREEQRRAREAEEAVDQAERERALIEAALQKALADAAGKHAEEVERLRAQLAEAEAKSQRAMSEAQRTKVGHVYVISNLGSFGPGVFKIGMTRRLEPMERVWELGDASVPFPFDVHMMVKCDDAPSLENALHKRFHTKRVNRVNPRKEFFRVTIDEIVVAVREHHGEVEYRADAEALEYMSSQTATEAEVEEIEEAYAAAEALGSKTVEADE
jgi:hypothetical protein